MPFLAAKYAGHWTWIHWSSELSYSPRRKNIAARPARLGRGKPHAPHALIPPHTLQVVSASSLLIICSA
jgi:hypothetical protein